MATTTTPPAIDTSALNPTFQALYDQQLPALQLAATQASQARGMFYSGNATNTQTLAQENLLASLLAQQQAQTQQTSINTQNINQQNNAQANQIAAANRQSNIGLLGAGVGAAAGLLGLKYLKPGSGLTNTMMVNGQPVKVNADGTYTPMTETGTGGSAIPENGPGGGAVSSNSFDGTGGPPALPTPDSGLGSLAGTTAPPNGLASLQSTPGAPDPLSLPGIGGDFAGVGGTLPDATAGLSGGMSSLPSSGLDGLTNLATSDLGSVGSDAVSSGIGDAASGLSGLASFARGGIVSKPTIAQIGDAGPGNPEEVIPLNKLQGAIGPQGAARVMAAVPQPGNPGFGQPPGNPGMSPGVAAPPPPGMPPAPMPSMWSQPSTGGPVPPQPVSPLAALQRGGLLGNLFKPS